MKLYACLMRRDSVNSTEFLIAEVTTDKNWAYDWASGSAWRAVAEIGTIIVENGETIEP